MTFGVAKVSNPNYLPDTIHSWYAIFTVLLAIGTCCAQDRATPDPGSTLSYVDKIILKLNLLTQTDTYNVTGASDDVPFGVAPNADLKIDLSLDYEFIGLSIGFSPRVLPGNDDDGLKGESSFTDYGFRFFFGNWTQELRYRRVQGFYVENTGDFLSDWIQGRDPYIQLPDLKTIFWGGSTSYVLNPRFSLRNVVYNTEWQRTSAGSFIPTLRYGFSRISSVVEGSKTYENSVDINLAMEYYYTWVIHEHWFVSPFLSPSFGVRFSSEGVEGLGSEMSETNWPVAFDGGLQLGYSSEKWIFGASVNFETTRYRETNRTNVLNDRIFAKAYFGYRLDPPKFIAKFFDN